MAELESEGTKTRGGVADFLREFADELDEADPRPAEAESDHDADRGVDTGRDDTADGDEDALDPKRITLIVGGNSATVTIPETVEFDVEVDSRSPMLGSGVHQEIEFQLSWEVANPDEATDELIQIE